MNSCKNIDVMKIAEFPPYDLLYIDPPWEQGLVKMFETMQFKQTGIERPNNNIDDILDKVSKLASNKKPIVVEYSVKGTERVINAFVKNGHRFNEVSTQTQGTKKPFNIISFNTELKLPKGLVGFKVVSKTVEILKPKVVFDCFAGIGLTAKTVINSGANYIGYELNPARFKRLKARIDAENLSK